jgi:nucleotide-binding universal stress UspA family protein
LAKRTLYGMSPNLIVSYDDTDNDRDALVLARTLAKAGASVGLAYVRHAPAVARDQELREQEHATDLLDRGAFAIGAPSAPRHVVVHASTGEGLRELALREGADIVVFGSDYRTAAGTVRPGTSAQRLLNGGPVAVALAPADLRSRDTLRVARIGVLGEAGDDAADETARSLALALDATVVGEGEPSDLLVVGSRAEGEHGRVTLSAIAEYEIETSSRPVLVVPRGVSLGFAGPVLHAA